MEAAGSSTRGNGWAPRGPASPKISEEPPGVPGGGAGAELGHCPDCTLPMLLSPGRVLRLRRRRGRVRRRRPLLPPRPLLTLRRCAIRPRGRLVVRRRPVLRRVALRVALRALRPLPLARRLQRLQRLRRLGGALLLLERVRGQGLGLGRGSGLGPRSRLVGRRHPLGELLALRILLLLLLLLTRGASCCCCYYYYYSP